MPLEVVRYDSIVFVSLDRDSVFVRDSVFLKEKGDTVEKFKSKYVYVYRVRVDTFYMEKMREVEVPVPVERKLTWWERVKLEYAEWLIGVLMRSGNGWRGRYGRNENTEIVNNVRLWMCLVLLINAF